MGSIHDVFREDDVNGVIVGGDFWCGHLFYDGRRQGRQLYADSQDELLLKAKQMKSEILSSCGSVATDIFPKHDAWSLKLL